MLTASQALLQALAAERRRVVSDWRAAVLLERATLTIPAERRRWRGAPTSLNSAVTTLRHMVRRGELRPLPKLTQLYEVAVPYANFGPISEHEVIMEAHPYAALAYWSAFVFHGLTNDLPQTLLALAPTPVTTEILPIGTRAEDWEALPRPLPHWPEAIFGHAIQWVRAKPHRYFGLSEYARQGYPVRVTTFERTLLDGLLQPELCGGIANVLTAWRNAGDTLNADELVLLVDRFNVAVLRQRVGYVLEALGRRHPELDRWQATAKRGGSSKLDGSAPYAPTYSERWSLSLNAPLGPLGGDA